MRVLSDPARPQSPTATQRSASALLGKTAGSLAWDTVPGLARTQVHAGLNRNKLRLSLMDTMTLQFSACIVYIYHAELHSVLSLWLWFYGTVCSKSSIHSILQSCKRVEHWCICLGGAAQTGRVRREVQVFFSIAILSFSDKNLKQNIF